MHQMLADAEVNHSPRRDADIEVSEIRREIDNALGDDRSAFIDRDSDEEVWIVRTYDSSSVDFSNLRLVFIPSTDGERDG